MAQSKWFNAGGALIYHALQLQKGINVIDHIRRAKLRIIELEMLTGITADEKKKNMSMKEAFWLVYDKLPFGMFSGTQFAKQCIFLTGRLDAHKDSVIRVLREFREEGLINAPNIEAPFKSLYMKMELDIAA